MNFQLVNGYKKQFAIWSNKNPNGRTISIGFGYKVLIIRNY